MELFDVVIVGAGAAGLMTAGIAGQLGQRVLLLDHSPKIAEKIRISGGGRCNFTNRELDVRAPQRHFISQNPHFCRSALSRYTPADFLALLTQYGVPSHEKHKGQLFCDRSAQDVIDVLVRECDAGGVIRRHGCSVQSVSFSDSTAIFSGKSCYELQTSAGPVAAPKLVVATGGLSIPAIGASAWGHQIARQFGLRLVETRPGLVPLTFDAQTWKPWAELAGLSLSVDIATGTGKASTQFREDLLLTHRGLSGPAILQISNYWREDQALRINLAPEHALYDALLERKALSRKRLDNELATWLPSRLAHHWTQGDALWQRPINEVPDKALTRLCEGLQRWTLTPTGTEGYRKAEVTLGGVDTRDLSSQTMQATSQAGLYFVGEVVDVTGWLGGYNFQWAWASAHACAQALAVTP